MNSSSNFHFLLAEFPGLARPAIKAEGYANNDPESALMNLRVFAETLATTLCGEAGLWYEKDPSFFQRLNDLRDEGLIEEHISDRFHLLRSKGNQASHGKTVNKSDAIGGLLSAFTVSKWFYEGYGDFRKVDEVRGLSFHPPKNQETKEQIQQLVNSKDEELKRLEEELNTAKSTHAQTQAELEIAQKEKKHRLQLASRRKEYLITEAETRRIIDEQLRQSGWEANTETLTYQAGARPEEGRNIAIAEWPTRNGRADYALFIRKERKHKMQTHL